MAISCEENDGKEESARDCCTTHCDKSCLQNASHSCTQALQAAAHSQQELIHHAEEAESATAAEKESLPSPSLASAAHPHPTPPPSPPSPSHLRHCNTHQSNSRNVQTFQNGKNDAPHNSVTAEKACATETNPADHQLSLSMPMALLNQSPSSSSNPRLHPASILQSSPPSTTTSLINDHQDIISKAPPRHSQQQEQDSLVLNDNASTCNSRDLSFCVAVPLDPNALEFIPIVPAFSSSSSTAILQQETQVQELHSRHTSYQAEMGSVNHQMASLHLEVGANNSMATYEPVPPNNHEQDYANHEVGTAGNYNMNAHAFAEADYSLSFYQNPEEGYENHGYGVFQAAANPHMCLYPVQAPAPGVLANPGAPLHHMGVPPAMAPPPSPFIRAPGGASHFMSMPPAGLVETAPPSSVVHSQRQNIPLFYSYGSIKEHVSRALLISGLPLHYTEAQVYEELERWGSIRAIQTLGSPQGLQVTVQFYDIRAARQALRDIQNIHQQGHHELHRSSSFQSDASRSNTEVPAAINGRRGLLCGNVVSAQYIAAWTMQVPNAHNQGTLVLFNVGADVSMQDVRRVFEAYGNVRDVREAPNKRQHKFVEFYDTRSAEAAWSALNGKEICGKTVKIEYSRPGGAPARRQKAHEPVHQQIREIGSNAGTQQNHGPISMDPFTWNADIPSSQYGVQGFFNGGPYHQGWDQRWPAAHESFFSHNPVNACMANHPPHALPLPNPPLHQDAVSRYGPGIRALGDGSGTTGVHEPQHGTPSGPRRGQQMQNYDPEFRPVVPTQSHCAGLKDRHMGGLRHLKGDASFKFDEDEIHARPTNPRTTLMIQNIPNKYSQKMLLSMLDQHCSQFNSNSGSNEPEAAYDFMYLPIDFKNKCNLGYAFVNFTTPQATLGFYKVFHGKAWEEFNSRKICGVAFARLQGRSALEEHFRTSRFACDTEEYLPVLFVPPRNGANLSQPRVAVGQMGIGRGCRAGLYMHAHPISNEPTPDSPRSEQGNRTPLHVSNSDTSSGSEDVAEEVSTEGVAHTADAVEMAPSERGV